MANKEDKLTKTEYKMLSSTLIACTTTFSTCSRCCIVSAKSFSVTQRAGVATELTNQCSKVADGHNMLAVNQAPTILHCVN